MMYYKRKKASLSLSINAIIILILAITMLGLGLTFMRGLFKQMESKVSEAVSASELTNPPTVDNVMTLAPSDITLRNNKNGEVMIAFLNVGSGGTNCGLDSDVGTAGGAVANIVFSSQTVAMETDQINTWLVSVAAIAEGTGIYTLTMKCGGSAVARKDLLVTVTA